MREKVLAILTELRDDVDFSASDKLAEDGPLTSLDIIFLVDELNDAFDISIPVLEVVPKNFNSIDAICNLVERLLNA